MSGFELEPVDGGTSIPLPQGEIQLGRGPFLGVSDKRVSRRHGLLENEGGHLRIKSTHQNPCFFQHSPGDPPEPLEKDRWRTLNSGDLFSLLPGKHVYRVVSIYTEGTQSNSQALEEEEPAVEVPPVSPGPRQEPERPTEPNGQSDPTLDLTQVQTGSTPTCPGEEDEEEEEEKNKTQPTASQEPTPSKGSPKPEPKKRVLPAWMMQIPVDASSPSTSTGDRKRGGGKAAPTPAKRPRPKKPRNRTVSSEESGQSEVEQTPRKKAKKTESYEEEETQSKVAAASPAAPARGPARSGNDGTGEESDELALSAPKEEGQRNGRPAPRGGRRRGGEPTEGPEKESQSRGRDGQAGGQEVNSAVAEGTSDGPGPSQMKAKAPPRTPCPYGKECYRKNPVHFQECSHPGDRDYVEGVDDEEGEEEEDEQDDRPECPYGTGCYRKNPQHKKEYRHTQDPGKKARSENRDDAGEDDDDEDSFINDDSEDADEDSDYDPSASDDSASARVDIKTLKKDARAFLRKRR